MANNNNRAMDFHSLESGQDRSSYSSEGQSRAPARGFGSAPASSSSAVGSSSSNKVKKVQYQAQAVADMARENIKMSLNQLERLDDMEEKAATLEAGGRAFHRGAVRVRRHFCYRAYRNIFLALICLAVLGVALYFIIHTNISSINTSSVP